MKVSWDGAKASIYIGFDPREAVAFNVAVRSTLDHLSRSIPITGLVLERLRELGYYTRPTERRDGRLYDLISQHTMSTEFAISRFLTPAIAQSGWALFMDVDVLVRDDLSALFAKADPRYAVMCVQHAVQPKATNKMDGQVQSAYFRKFWSSVMLFNCDHPANKRLTIPLINSLPGRDLHAFCWLEDSEIGALDPAYNYLVGYGQEVASPKIVHFTDGTPDMPGYADCEYADEWREVRSRVSGLTSAVTSGTTLVAAGSAG